MLTTDQKHFKSNICFHFGDFFCSPFKSKYYDSETITNCPRCWTINLLDKTNIFFDIVTKRSLLISSPVQIIVLSSMGRWKRKNYITVTRGRYFVKLEWNGKLQVWERKWSVRLSHCMQLMVVFHYQNNNELKNIQIK